MKELSPYLVRRTVAPPSAQPGSFNEPLAESTTESDLWDFWRVIKKRRRVIGGFFFTIMITVGISTLLMTRTYTSEATLLIEEKGPQVVDIKQVLSEPVGGSDRHDYYETQYEILKSRALAAQVIREQNLASNKVFTGEKTTRTVAPLWSSVRRWMDIGPRLSSLRSSAKKQADAATATLMKLVGTYLNYLEIKPVRDTRLVQIAFTTPDPDLSTKLANAHAQAYIRQGLELRALANKDAEQFLEKKLAELKGRVEESEAVLNKYRREKGIISLDDRENVVVDRLADLNKRLMEAEADKITLQAQVQLIRLRAFDSLPAVINNPLITTLKGELSKLEGEYANLSAEYNLGYPRLAQVKAQLDQTRKRLHDEVQSAVAGLESAYLAAEAKDKELRQKMTDQTSAALRLKDASVEYAILARDVDTNNQLYNSILQRTNEMRVAGGIATSNVYIVDEAKPPLEPSGPKRALSLLFGVLIGAMGSVALAVLLEYSDKTVSRPEEIDRYLRLPTLAVVPDFSELGGERVKASLFDFAKAVGLAGVSRNGSGNGKSHVAALVTDHAPVSLVAESYRSLQTSLLLSQSEEPPSVVLFTSGLRDEGKTATAVNTAIVFAQMEAKVLVIDADLRMSACHKRLLVERGPGLSELLTGQRTVEEVIKNTPTDNLFVITGGTVPPDPAKLVGSRMMYEVLTSLRGQFDYIFIDSPPLIPVSDAVRLSTMVDGVVFVVKGTETTRDVLKDACCRLRYAQAKILGVVLNRVDLKSGDYGDYGYYYRDYYRTTASPEVT